MQSAELIAAGDFCAFHHVELSFITGLHESGLIGMTVHDGAVMLASEDLPALEKFVRWHYELAINFEGIEALAHLLRRVDNLQEENRVLRNRLRRYEGREASQAGSIEEI